MSIHSIDFLKQTEQFTMDGGEPVTVEIYSGSLKCGRLIQDHGLLTPLAWECGSEASYEARGFGVGHMACPEHLWRAVNDATAEVLAES